MKKGVATKRQKTGSIVVSLRLRTDQVDGLDAMATENGTGRSSLIQIAIARLLKEGLHRERG